MAVHIMEIPIMAGDQHNHLPRRLRVGAALTTAPDVAPLEEGCVPPAAPGAADPLHCAAAIWCVPISTRPLRGRADVAAQGRRIHVIYFNLRRSRGVTMPQRVSLPYQTYERSML